MTDRRTHGHTDGTDFIPSTADAGGNETALTHPTMTSFAADEDKEAHEDRELCQDLARTTQGHETQQTPGWKQPESDNHNI